MTEQIKMDGTELESVGTFLRNDGMTFPMNADGTVAMGDWDWALGEPGIKDAIDWCEGVHIADIYLDGDWMNALSDEDRAVVNEVLNDWAQEDGERN